MGEAKNKKLLGVYYGQAGWKPPPAGERPKRPQFPWVVFGLGFPVPPETGSGKPRWSRGQWR